jgi:hypothetical protein
MVFRIRKKPQKPKRKILEESVAAEVDRKKKQIKRLEADLKKLRKA